MQKKSFWEQYKMPILLLGGIAIGSIIGIISPAFGQKLKPIGDIFLNLLFTIVVPLVFVSIASAVGSMVNMKRLGKILGSTIAVFLITGAIAGVCVLTWVNIFSPSAGTNIQLGAAEMGEAKTAAELIVESLTVSDFNQLLSKSHMLPLIIFSIIFGFCTALCGGEESPVGKLLANLNNIIMKFVGVIMTIAPPGPGRLLRQPHRRVRSPAAGRLWPGHGGVLPPCACCMWSSSSPCTPCSPAASWASGGC